MQENNSTQVVPEVQPVQIANDQQPKTNSFLVILLSILLVISVVISGFFAFQTQKLVKELTSLKSEEKVALATTGPSATESSEVDLTKDWKTYTNTKLKLTFKYPQTFNKVEEAETSDPDNDANKGIRFVASNQTEELILSTDFMGGWGRNPCLMHIEKEIQGYASQVLIFKKEIINTETCENKYVDFVALINNSVFDHPFPIMIELRPKEPNTYSDTKFFDQILSTFKFLD